MEVITKQRKITQSLLLVQPCIPSYRIPVFQLLDNQFRMIVFADELTAKSGFKSKSDADEKSSVSFKRRDRSLLALISYLLVKQPDLVLVNSDLKDPGYWSILLLGKILRIRVFVHGQGLVKKPQPGRTYLTLFGISSFLMYRYICYAPVCAKSLQSQTIPNEKVRITHNALSLEKPVSPSEKSNNCKDILFLGRLRGESGVPELANAVSKIRDAGIQSRLHIIGSGEHELALKKQFAQLPWIKFHGATFDSNEIAVISQNCLIGAYAGNAGLSVVHYMGLSLVPMVHDAIHLHQGPEPSYVEDGINGCTFKQGDIDSLSEKMFDVLSNRRKAADLAASAFKFYQRLQSPSLGEQIAAILYEDQEL